MTAHAQTEAQNQQFAANLVTNVLHAKTGDMVVIFADSSHMALVEDVATQLRKVGAYAIADIRSNREGKMYYQYVPAKYDSQPPNDAIRLASIASSIVSIDYPNDPSVLAGVSPVRLAAVNNAGTAYTTYILKQRIPHVNIGNGLMPAPETAAQFGVSETALSSLFWTGVNADYARLHRDALRIGNTIARRIEPLCRVLRFQHSECDGQRREHEGRRERSACTVV